MNDKIRSIVTHALTALLAAAVTFFVQDFSDFRNDKRAEQRAIVATQNSVAEELQKILVDMKEVANGERSSNPEDVEKLRLVLLKDRASAQQLASIVPASSSELDPFEKASVNLLKEAERLKGPLDAPRMTEALSEYLYRRGELIAAAENSRNSYLQF
ncbi:hypothetical protein U0C82_12880 [Fulvimarina sp. 2208YS6-2-32]|uniref:LysB family phage lysis regulatory protein n=1 Tax=Fulvimarina uroteuthidis TaxID=3098149 RepID=A0ABU5I5F4_9HYPH|nr:hypothetical protein [Fulvimarina sp. 2208YS6-2-32]MDY8110034.1 hypothetical protein [Fulvimarina sp. 2208YS6-2-32]